MFLKRTHSKNFTYLSIVETYREDGQVKHRTLLQLGREDELKENGTLQGLVASIARVGGVYAGEEGQVCFKDATEESRHNWGAVRVCRELWDLFELDEILRRACLAKRRTFDLAAVVFAAVVARVMRPSSKLKVYERQQDYFGLQPVSLDHLYRAMDCLADGKDAIEQELFERQRDLFNLKIDVVLYDVTTLYFESVRADELRDFGYGKDGKFNEVQIMVGLLVDMEGRPIGFDTFPGNTFEGHTLITALKKLKERFQIRQVVVVADRGINSKVNLHEIKEAGFDYIVGARLKNLASSVQREVLDRGQYSVLESNDDGEVTLEYRVIEHTHRVKVDDANGGKKSVPLSEQLVCTWSKDREAKDKRDRERLVEKAKQLLAAPSKMNSRRGPKRFVAGDGKQNFELDEKRIKEDEKWDGFYGIQASRRDFSPKAILQAYHSLWKVEESFRVIKHTLQARPIFHWTANRIKGHLVMCFLAFLIERTLEIRTKKTCDDVTIERLREALASLQVSVVQTDAQKLYLTSKVSGLAAQMLRSLKIPAPKPCSPEPPVGLQTGPVD